MRAEDVVKKINAFSTNSSAKSERFILQFPTWHPCRRVCDCLSDPYRPGPSKILGRAPHRLLHNSSRANILH